MTTAEYEQSDQIEFPESTRRFKVIACAIMARELYTLAAVSRNIIDITLMPKGLHDQQTDQMTSQLQQQIDQVAADSYDAILLAYARCNDGVVGLAARNIPLVIPRAHDCITLLLGSRQAYNEYFSEHPGTYYYTTGWIERNRAGENQTVMQQLGLDKSYQQYVQQYGQDNAKHIMETVSGWKKNYNSIAYISLPTDDKLGYEELARSLANKRRWRFETLQGSLSLLERLLEGQWNHDFLIVKPGQQIAASNDQEILKSIS